MTRNHFLELQSHRQTYKKAFIDEKLWAILAQTLGKLLKKDFGERSEDDGLVIERILILVRNILQVPRDSTRERCNNDEVWWFPFKIPFLRFLLYVSDDHSFIFYCIWNIKILEIFLYLSNVRTVRSQNPGLKYCTYNKNLRVGISKRLWRFNVLCVNKQGWKSTEMGL